MIKAEDNTNALFPVFLKLESLRLLIVGGGKVGLEKLQGVLRNSPATNISLIGKVISDEIKLLAKDNPLINLSEENYNSSYIDNADVVIVAVNDKSLSEQIRNDAKQKGKLVNVADTPELCDFYLSSVVQKGNLKIAISTNGKSPTIAKRLKETFNTALPDELDDILNNMEVIRKRMNGNFADRVYKLNNITRVLVNEETEESKKKNRKFGKIAGFVVIALLFMALGQVLFPYLTIYKIFDNTRTIIFDLGSQFYSMLLTGFVAQIFASSLGMGYGVICTTILLSFGINLPAISGSIHTAETFSMGVAGYSHYRFGNINKKLLRALLIPGIIGAVLGAWMLSHFGNKYAIYIKPVIALYTLALGLKILSNAFRKKKIRRGKVRNANILAGVGGFIDSFGGGGWGPLVTSSIIAKGKSPRYVIGTSDIGKFFVTFASALTFFHFLGVSHWQIVAGLLIGGVAAAPIGAKLAGILPGKIMYISVGFLVILCSLRIFFKAIGLF